MRIQTGEVGRIERRLNGVCLETLVIRAKLWGTQHCEKSIFLPTPEMLRVVPPAALLKLNRFLLVHRFTSGPFLLSTETNELEFSSLCTTGYYSNLQGY